MKKLFVTAAMLALSIGMATSANAAEVTAVADLQTAISAGGTVTLGDDIDLGSTALTFPDDTLVTIDLNGKTLSRSQSGYVLTLEAADRVVITDSVGTGAVTKAGGFYFFYNEGQLRIEGGTYAKSGYYDLVYLEGNSSVEITGGTFTLNNIIARQSTGSTATISGGTFTVDTIATGIWDKGTSITGGTFTLNTNDTPVAGFVDTDRYTVTNTTGSTYVVGEKPASYDVTCETAQNGAVKAEPQTAVEGETVTLTITPGEGYELDTLSVKDEAGKDVTVANNQFAMPAGKVTVTATFKLAPQYITLALESPRGLKTTVQANINGTVADLEAVVAEQCGVTFGDSSPYRLFGADLAYPNHKLDDDSKLLKDIGFAEGQTIHLEKDSTETWDASGNEAIKIFGLTITGGTGAQEPYGAYSSANYEWNYANKTITIRTAPANANITISGTADPNVHIVVRSGSWNYLTLDNVTMTKDGTACITVNASAKLDLTLKGTNTLTTNSKIENSVEKSHPALELNQSSSQLRIKDGGNGTLTASSTCTGMPGIGTSGDDQSVGKITVNDGTIVANGGPGAPGLRSSSLYMKGGKLTANGGVGSTSDIYLYGTENKSIQIIKGTTPPVVVADVIMADVPGYVNINEGTEIGKITAPDVYFNVDTAAEVTGNAWYLLKQGTAANGTITIPDDGFTMNQPSNYGKAGETITITAHPGEDYTAEIVKANDETLTGSADHQYSFTMPNRSVTVTAVFSPVTYTVTFESGDGTTTSVAGISGAYALPECTFTAPAGMRFKAWSVNGNEYAPEAVIQVSADLTVKAVWEAIPVSGSEPAIISPTTDQTVTVYEGGQATMSVTAENAVSYQWYINYNDGTGWHKCGGNSPSYTSDPATLGSSGYLYKCVVTGENGSTAESRIFTLTVLEKRKVPQTGDGFDPHLWMSLCVMSCAGMFAITMHRKKNRTE